MFSQNIWCPDEEKHGMPKRDFTWQLFHTGYICEKLPPDRIAKKWVLRVLQNLIFLKIFRQIFPVFRQIYILERANLK